MEIKFWQFAEAGESFEYDPRRWNWESPARSNSTSIATPVQFLSPLITTMTEQRVPTDISNLALVAVECGMFHPADMALTLFACEDDWKVFVDWVVKWAEPFGNGSEKDRERFAAVMEAVARCNAESEIDATPG